jgi:hypothetical protein
MFTEQRSDETFEEFFKRCQEIAESNNECRTVYNEQMIIFQRLGDKKSKTPERPDIVTYVCIKEYKSFLVGDVLRRQGNLFHNGVNAINEDEIVKEYFEPSIKIL